MLHSVKVRVALLLLVIHAVVLTVVGVREPGPPISDAIQLLLGGIVLWCCLDASRVLAPYARYMWRIAALSFGIWCVGQSLGLITELIPVFTGHQASLELQWYCSVLTELWILPLGLTLFIRPEQAPDVLDWIFVLDILQISVVVLAAFLFFFRFPLQTGSFDVDLANSVRSPYFLLHAAIVAAFAIRAIYDKHRPTKSFFRGFTLYLCLSMAADLIYFYSPLHNAPTGSSFDIVWSMVLLVAISSTDDWEHKFKGLISERPEISAASSFLSQFFPLLFPLFVLSLSSQLSATHRTAAFLVVFFSYAILSARLLLSHNQLVGLQHSLEHRASHDLLTGLQNRAAILEILDRELKRAQRFGGSVGVVMLDADHFKALNDQFGHLTGDRLLEFLGVELKRMMRPYDAAGRYGGEEFLLVLPGCNLEESAAFARRVREMVETMSINVNQHTLRCTVSCGVACATGDTSMNDALRAADRALYAAKALGRNRVEVAPASEVAS